MKRKIVVCPNQECRLMQLNTREHCRGCSTELPSYYQESRTRRDYTLGDLLLLAKLEKAGKRN